MTGRQAILLAIFSMVIAITLCGVVNLFLTSPTSQYYNDANGHFPRIAGTVGAPNGTYDVWVSEIHNDSTVAFPLCESYGGHLHGTWLYDSEAIVFEENMWYHVVLENNVIVSVERTN